MKKFTRVAIAAVALSALLATPAAAFSLSFGWGNLKKCTNGRPNRVNNPAFKLSGVPDGTARIRFTMKDLNKPSYNHGGGTVQYSGSNSIQPGAFKYKSPCPPSGSHTYEWTATAMDGKGKKIGEAKSRKSYP